MLPEYSCLLPKQRYLNQLLHSPVTDGPNGRQERSAPPANIQVEFSLGRGHLSRAAGVVVAEVVAWVLA